jgi:hypothetical protein
VTVSPSSAAISGTRSKPCVEEYVRTALACAAIAMRSARILASGTLNPFGVGSAKRLYETLGNFPSTEGAVACGFFNAHNARCRHATRPMTVPKVPSDMARRWLVAVPIHLGPSVTSSAIFIVVSGKIIGAGEPEPFTYVSRRSQLSGADHQICLIGDGAQGSGRGRLKSKNMLDDVTSAADKQRINRLNDRNSLSLCNSDAK